jgi:hypothetical protein
LFSIAESLLSSLVGTYLLFCGVAARSSYLVCFFCKGSLIFSLVYVSHGISSFALTDTILQHSVAVMPGKNKLVLDR